jgi:hypothetical protein
MAIFDVKVLADGFSFFAGRFPREATKEMGDAAQKTAMRFREVFIKARLSGRPGLNKVGGWLQKSFRVGHSPRGAPLDQVVSWLASRSPYGPIHETGGTIRPKRRRMLAIPLPAALTEGRQLKGEAVRLAPAAMKFGKTQIRKGERTLYARKDLTFIKSKKGNALLVKKVGDRIVPMYVLKASVKIPARMKFFDTFRSWSGKPAALRFFSSGLRRLIDKLWGRRGKR